MTLSHPNPPAAPKKERAIYEVLMSTVLPKDEFGVRLTPIVAWNHPTPATLAQYIARQIHGDQTTSETEQGAKPTPPRGDLQDLLAEVENLSDEEVARLLAEEK